MADKLMALDAIIKRAEELRAAGVFAGGNMGSAMVANLVKQLAEHVANIRRELNSEASYRREQSEQ